VCKRSGVTRPPSLAYLTFLNCLAAIWGIISNSVQLWLNVRQANAQAAAQQAAKQAAAQSTGASGVVIDTTAKDTP
jgi:hypothetical protein